MEKQVDKALGDLFSSLNQQPFLLGLQSHTNSKPTRTTKDLVKKYSQEISIGNNKLVENSNNIYCRPWNYEDYIARVKSFSKVHEWFAKPSHMSPSECARRGWSNSGMNKLHCFTCANDLLIDSTEDEENGHVYLGTAHTVDCGWRSSFCDESFGAIRMSDERSMCDTFLLQVSQIIRCIISDSVHCRGPFDQSGSSGLSFSVPEEIFQFFEHFHCMKMYMVERDKVNGGFVKLTLICDSYVMLSVGSQRNKVISQFEELIRSRRTCQQNETSWYLCPPNLTTASASVDLQQTASLLGTRPRTNSNSSSQAITLIEALFSRGTDGSSSSSNNNNNNKNNNNNNNNRSNTSSSTPSGLCEDTVNALLVLACCLVMCGWTKHASSSSTAAAAAENTGGGTSLYCEYCGRTFSAFKATQDDNKEKKPGDKSISISISSNSSHSGTNLGLEFALKGGNILNQHRHFCPIIATKRVEYSLAIVTAADSKGELALDNNHEGASCSSARHDSSSAQRNSSSGDNSTDISYTMYGWQALSASVGGYRDPINAAMLAHIGNGNMHTTSTFLSACNSQQSSSGSKLLLLSAVGAKRSIDDINNTESSTGNSSSDSNKNSNDNILTVSAGVTAHNKDAVDAADAATASTMAAAVDPKMALRRIQHILKSALI